MGKGLLNLDYGLVFISNCVTDINEKQWFYCLTREETKLKAILQDFVDKS